MVHVTFLPDQITVAVPEGTTLLRAQIDAGLRPDAPCGGRGTCGKCQVLLDGGTVLACKTLADRDMTVILPRKETVQVLTEGVGGPLEADGAHAYAAAFDIGTTTLVGFLLDGRTGQLLASASAVNPQTQYGADVIARIEAAMASEEPVLQNAILPSLRELLGEMSAEAGIAPEQITLVSLVVLLIVPAPGYALIALIWLLLGFALSAMQTPIGRIIRANASEEDLSYVFAAQFSLSHACYLITYPVAGWIGDSAGLWASTAALAVLAVLGTVMATLTWPKESV